MKDFYDILGVPPDASADEIRRMYHKLSKKYHPDANAADPDLRQWADARMKELNEAYDTLKEPDRRARYNLVQGYSRPHPENESADSHAPGWGKTVAQWRESYIWRSAGVNAAIFGLFGLTRGVQGAISGAIMGAMFGAMMANVRLMGLPPAVTNGMIAGMLMGALLRLSIPGIIGGGLLGGLIGWWLGRR
jgi:curved DNA-binding protein CbpA